MEILKHLLANELENLKQFEIDLNEYEMAKSDGKIELLKNLIALLFTK